MHNNIESLYESIIETVIEELGMSEEEASALSEKALSRINMRLSGEISQVVKSSRTSELNKFIDYAKSQGTSISFSAMEQGILAAGRQDMQNGLSELADSLKFEKQTCGECEKTLDNRGRGKKKLLTAVGEVEIHPTRYSCPADTMQSIYPLLNFISLIEHEVLIGDGSTVMQTIKCTRDAAAAIALVCAENTYATSSELLHHLAGWDLNVMTGFRVTDSVGSEFVEPTPEAIDEQKITEMAEKSEDNILAGLIADMKTSENQEEVDEIIREAVADGAAGILRSEYTGQTIKVMYIECDGTGVPGRKAELLGVNGKQADGGAKTFEAKIGAVFTVEHTIDGKPLLTGNGEIYRDRQTKYVGTVRKVDAFGSMLYQHALENGLEDADVVVFLGDGAKWIWNIQEKYFPNALTGIDLYHAIEKIGNIIDLLQFKGRGGAEKRGEFKDECIELLKHGKIQDLLDKLDAQPCKIGTQTKLQKAKDYFSNNIDRMNYGIFTALGLFVGSGVIEAGCKVIVGNRMKNAGMHWSKVQAEKMIALRCAIKNKVFYYVYTTKAKQMLLHNA